MTPEEIQSKRDEIVEKIDAKLKSELLAKPWIDLDGYFQSIDIVKSVLKVEE